MVQRYVRVAVGAGCAYEAFALTTRKVPTLSKMCRHSRGFEVFFFAALLTHIHLERRLVEALKVKLLEETELVVLHLTGLKKLLFRGNGLVVILMHGCGSLRDRIQVRSRQSLRLPGNGISRFLIRVMLVPAPGMR